MPSPQFKIDTKIRKLATLILLGCGFSFDASALDSACRSTGSELKILISSQSLTTSTPSPSAFGRKTLLRFSELQRGDDQSLFVDLRSKDLALRSEWLGPFQLGELRHLSIDLNGITKAQTNGEESFSAQMILTTKSGETNSFELICVQI